MSKINAGPQAEGLGKHKGQSENTQKGAKTVSKREAGKHEKDDSNGSSENTTKKQQNSI